MVTYLWGIGGYFRSKISEDSINFYKIDGFIDKKETYEYMGKKCIRPDEIRKNDIDRIVIGSINYKEEIEKEIKEMNLDCEVLFLDEYKKLIWLSEMPPDIKCALSERERMLDMALSAKPISPSKMVAAKAFANRIDALSIIPKGGVVAEVGVAYGDFSKEILRQIKPNKFFAIDFFNGDSPGGDIWGRTYFRDTGLTHQEWYRKEFKEYLDNNTMEIRQGFSWEVLSEFSNDFFDFVYLDACHSYDSVRKDMDVLLNKVKEGGIITFNDYTFYNFYTDPLSEEGYYGVANVANKLLHDTNSVVLGVALERCLSMDLIVEIHK